MINDNELNLDFIMNKRYSLTERTLEEIVDKVQNTYGLEVLEIVENDDGYVFKGKYGFTIGDLTYDTKQGRYRGFNYHRGVVESINERDKKVASRRKYKVQRNKRIGVAFTAAGMVVLIGIGVIKLSSKENVVKQEKQVGTQTVAVQQSLNTINSANDLILLAWANHAMGQVTDICNSSEYDAVRSIRSDVYSNMFVPVMQSYYDYIDRVDSPLPYDINGDLMEKYHTNFRDKAKEFDEYLKQLSIGSTLSFADSIFTDAVVFDSEGKVVTANDRFKGEVKGVTEDLLTYDDSSYTVCVPAVNMSGKNYSIDNLPEDAKIYNGEAYVDYSYMYKGNELDNKSK